MTVFEALAGAAVPTLGLLAVLVGSPLTNWVLHRVERAGATFGESAHEPGPPGGNSPQSADPGAGVHAPTNVLGGGRAIGRLERSAVFLGLVAGWPESIAVVVALKGLGRFAELRGATHGTAERFIIGTFTSLLWAGALGALARLCVLTLTTS
ncbi:MAG: hypothetical protein CSA84_01245 [Actinomycetales bacterium]|nr:MAG: hypothetical protein CSA84_01245 [Actinomycetales bacterium]